MATATRLDRHKREIDALTTTYRVFRRAYRNDPAAFVHDCISWEPGKGPAFYQDEVMSEVTTHRRVSVRGPHGLGKTAMASWLMLWFALTQDDDADWKVPVTASAWRQLTKFLFPEVRKWMQFVRWDKVGRQPFRPRAEMLDLSIKLATGEAFALASDNSALIEGAHADKLMYIFDEAKEIPPGTWDSAEGAFASGDCYWVAISTPGEPNGRFYDIQSRKPGYGDWWVKHVTLDDVIKAGRINRDWVENRRLSWGEDSSVFKNRALGEFASSDEDGVIPLAWVERAQDRYLEWKDAGAVLPPFTALGVDVGRGGDKSVLAPRYDMIILELIRSGKADTMQTTGQVAAYLRKHGGRAVVDVIGIGAGVVDRLTEQDFNVVPFNAAERTDMLDMTGEFGFTNKRSAAWWGMREILDPANGYEPMLPPDDLLTGDLTAPHWRYVSGGNVQIESKDDIRKRLHRSTDDGDAVVMSYFDDHAATWEDVSDMGHVEDYVSPWK